MKILYLWDWLIEPGQATTQQDGHIKIIEEFRERGHEVEFHAIGKEEGIVRNPLTDIIVSKGVDQEVSESFMDKARAFKPDAILIWSDSTRPHIPALYKLGKPMYCLFAGGEPIRDYYHYFDHVFVESQTYLDKFKEAGMSTSIAFGTNTDLFRPGHSPLKPIDALFLATYCNWKRHHLFSEATRGMVSMACGYMYQDHETECWRTCQRAGVITLPHVSSEVAANMYQQSKVCVVPSHTTGGSQRTVLEALATNTPVVVCSDAEKLTEYINKAGGYIADPTARSIKDKIKEAMDNPLPDTRQWVLENYSHKVYADKILEIIK